MTALEWDQTDGRRYEAGVSHGVFYPTDGPGIVWNGLLSVEESAVGGDTTASYLDGVHYLTTIGSRFFQAKLSAFSAPREFSPYAGDRASIPGFVLTKQPKRRFNLSYQTGIGDGDGYKIHLVYNVLATPTTVGYQTISDTPLPATLAWKIDATPVEVPGFKPTAHLVADSTKAPVGVMESLEGILYGTSVSPAAFPTVEVLRELFEVMT